MPYKAIEGKQWTWKKCWKCDAMLEINRLHVALLLLMMAVVPLIAAIPCSAPQIASPTVPQLVHRHLKNQSLVSSSALTFPPSVSPKPYILINGLNNRSSIASTIHSSTPSQKPSQNPSEELVAPHLSDFPSMAPSLQPSTMAFASLVSDSPSISPSDFPSVAPSIHPSRSPSTSPSDHPSEAPSRQPSGWPSGHPTLYPSRLPTLLPTTDIPSMSPSDYPSMAPSLACHDDLSYVSPINNLTCADHQGTDCTQWRFVGLTIDEVQTLIEKCPQSCNIPCGAFLQFRVKVVYHISNVPGLMSFDTVDTLQEVSKSYLTSYVLDNVNAAKFVVENVELLSQAILWGARTRELRGQQFASSVTRKLQSATNVNLEVTVIFAGFAVGINSDSVTENLVSGIDDPNYTLKIQRSGDPFLATAEASSAINNDSATTSSRAKETSSSSSTASTVAAVAVAASLVVAFFSAVAYLHFRRSGHWFPTYWSSARPKPLDCITAGSPRTLESGIYLTQAESSPTCGSPTTLPSGPGLLRLIASNSKDSTSSSSESNQSIPSLEPEHDGINTTNPLVMTTDIILEESQDDDESKEGHPLEGIFPPMIVFDNIDNLEEAHEDGVTCHDNYIGEGLGMPTRHMEAPPELLAALNECNESVSTTNFAEMMYHESPGLYMQEISASKSFLEPLNSPTSTGIYSSDLNDEASIASTPIPATISGVELKRKSKSFSALDELAAVATSIEGILLSPQSRNGASELSNLDVRSRDNDHGNFKVGVVDDQTDSSSSSSLSPTNQGPLPVQPAANTARKGYRSDTSAEESFGEASTVRRGTTMRAGRQSLFAATDDDMMLFTLGETNVNSLAAQDSLAEAASEWRESPRESLSAAAAKSTPRPNQLPSGQVMPPVTKSNFMVEISPPRPGTSLAFLPTPGLNWEEWPISPLHSNNSSSTDDSPHNKNKTRNRNLHAVQTIAPIEVRFEFTVPRKGKLGLVIASSFGGNGPVIHAVKDASPLLGRVYPGDKIVQVDDTDTTNMSLFAITNLLTSSGSPKRGWRNSSNSNNNNNNNKMLRIVVARPVPTEPSVDNILLLELPILTHLRTDSLGASTLTSVQFSDNDSMESNDPVSPLQAATAALVVQLDATTWANDVDDNDHHPLV